jgi:hypothetical protein
MDTSATTNVSMCASTYVCALWADPSLPAAAALLFTLAQRCAQMAMYFAADVVVSRQRWQKQLMHIE